ncbi:MAG: hypothetical protein K0S32_2243 [Bacteroidetes bacterium]|jgi:hypothetical protein|nr:hypothetical protein [Bacteroidota bacterium]
MNKLFLFLAVLFCTSLNAQVSNIDHPSVTGVSAIYKATEQYGSTEPEVMVIPECSVVLKSGSGATKIHVKIKNPTDQSVIYEASHVLNSSSVSNGAGKKLFENNSGTIFISNGSAIVLKPYLYEVKTENSQGEITAAFTEIK